jgi:cysteine desulfurase
MAGTIDAVNNNTPIYLDYAAATPLDAEVLAAMQPYFTDMFYNPSASYLAARRVSADIENARAQIARWLGAKPAEIIFTAGATEGNNLAINGVMQRFAGANVIVSAIEHIANLAPAQQYPHALLPVNAKGIVAIEKLSALIDDQTVLVSVSMANNEVGTIQPLRKISLFLEEVRVQRQKAGNTLPIYLHTDAAQATPYLDLHTARLGVDLLTINGGKMYGPKQTGALFVSSKVQLQPQVLGGGQERGLRSGTENVPGIIGLATALNKAQQSRKEVASREQKLRDILMQALLREFDQVVVNGDTHKRLPNNLHVSWPGYDGERIVMAADERGLMIATGAACSANKQTGSHVLAAMGLDDRLRDGSIRFSLGAPTTEADIDGAVAILREVVRS